MRRSGHQCARASAQHGRRAPERRGARRRLPAREAQGGAGA
jgi:hypothetical protein